MLGIELTNRQNQLNTNQEVNCSTRNTACSHPSRTPSLSQPRILPSSRLHNASHKSHPFRRSFAFSSRLRVAVQLSSFCHPLPPFSPSNEAHNLCFLPRWHDCESSSLLVGRGRVVRWSLTSSGMLIEGDDDRRRAAALPAR